MRSVERSSQSGSLLSLRSLSTDQTQTEFTHCFAVVKTITIQDVEGTRQKGKRETEEFFMHPLEFMLYFTVR